MWEPVQRLKSYVHLPKGKKDTQTKMHETETEVSGIFQCLILDCTVCVVEVTEERTNLKKIKILNRRLLHSKQLYFKKIISSITVRTTHSF